MYSENNRQANKRFWKLIAAVVVILIILTVGIITFITITKGRASDEASQTTESKNVEEVKQLNTTDTEFTNDFTTSETVLDATTEIVTDTQSDSASVDVTEEESGDYLIQLLLMEEHQIIDDVNGDGTEELITVDSNWSDEYWGDGLIITVGDKSYTDEDVFLQGYDSWLYNDQFNNKYVITSIYIDGGEYRTVIYAIDGENFTKICDIWDEYVVELLKGEINTSGYNHCFGTYTTSRNYTLSLHGFVPTEDRYWFYDNMEMETRRGPITKQSVKVQLSKDNVMVESQLQAGTRIYPVNTDKISVVGFVLEDGTYGEIFFEIPDGEYRHFIDGVDEYELFDDLIYVG